MNNSFYLQYRTLTSSLVIPPFISLNFDSFHRLNFTQLPISFYHPEQYQQQNQSEFFLESEEISVKSDFIKAEADFIKSEASSQYSWFPTRYQPSPLFHHYNDQQSLKNEVLTPSKEEAPKVEALCKAESELPSSSPRKIWKTHSLEKLHLKNEISEMLKFFVETYGNTSPQELEYQRTKCIGNSVLIEIFCLLGQKYSEASKCREDMVRLLIRKALTFMRDELNKEHKLNSKQASLALCKKYFLKDSCVTLNNDKVKLDDVEDQILGFFLPYKKYSRNKTPNARFIEEVFLSKEFLQAYTIYLFKFDEILKKDNQKKMQRFTDYICDCIKEKDLDKIKAYKRMPWLNSWIAATKVIAYELLDTNISRKPTMPIQTLNDKKKKEN